MIRFCPIFFCESLTNMYFYVLMKVHNPHILVIDDNHEILQTLEIILKRRHYEVTLIERCENITNLVQNLQPDLVLLDKSLGWADGTTLCQTLKADPMLSD